MSAINIIHLNYKEIISIWYIIHGKINYILFKRMIKNNVYILLIVNYYIIQS